MAIEQLFEALPLHYLRHGISKFGAANILLAVVVTAALGVLVDYAWMLFLRSKMVSLPSKFGGGGWLISSSLLARFPTPSLATHSSYQTTNLGFTSKNSRKSTTRP
jgi:hypothetical protein